MVYPVVALALSFLLGSATHPNDFYTYRWSCGMVHLPSISRVINMPLERTIFQMLILCSVPLRLIILFRHCELLTHCRSGLINVESFGGNQSTRQGFMQFGDP
uniref:Secreted protein n=1 Tax=Angiostrongylus cantonensis TaxID=6313 RepID=A0A0K0CTZ5_ANGCA